MSLRKTFSLTAFSLFALFAASSFASSASAQEQDHARIRLGVGAGVGPGFYLASNPNPSQTGFQFLGQGRLGIQFSDLLGLYYQMGASAVGVNVNTSTGTSEFQVNGLWMHALGLDLTFGNFFQLGLNGGIDTFGSGFNAYPGAGARLAFMLGTTGPGARGAFSIFADVHSTFLTDRSDMLITPSLGVGFELF